MVELLTGELVANAVVHGPADRPVTVRVRIDGDTRSGSWSATPAAASRPSGTPSRRPPSGRGLALVEALSSDWGTHDRPDGKTVWFEVRTDE